MQGRHEHLYPITNYLSSLVLSFHSKMLRQLRVFSKTCHRREQTRIEEGIRYVVLFFNTLTTGFAVRN